MSKMENERISTVLINERIATRDRRNASREAMHNKRRSGLSAVPTFQAADKLDETEMSRICAVLRGRSSNLSISDLRMLKHLLLQPNGIAAFMKDKGALHGLIRELSGKRPKQQLEAVNICINLGLGDEEYSLPVCRAAGPYLIQYLEGTSSYLQEASAWAIGNLAGSSTKCGAIISSQGAVIQLIQLLLGINKNVSLAAAYALNHIIHSKAALPEEELLKIVQHSSVLVSTEPEFCVLLYLLSCFPVCEEVLLKERIITQAMTVVAELIENESQEIKSITALWRTVGNLSCGTGALELVNFPDIISLIQRTLMSPHKHLCKECTWICANLLCHNHQDVRNFAEHTDLRNQQIATLLSL